MNNPAIIALITVQETNSSYLPDSHFKQIGGKPLFQLMIEKLLLVATINRIVVTTDSEVVRKLYAGNAKITLISTPSDDTLSEDTSQRILEEMPTSDRMTAHSLAKTDGEHYLQTQCINPLLTVQTIEDAIERYYSYVLNEEFQQFDSVMSLARVEKRLYDNSDYPKITLRDNPHFVIYEDTVFNIFNRSAFKRNGNKKFGKNPMFYEVPEIENLSVETPTSFKLVKLVYENQGQLL